MRSVVAGQRRAVAAGMQRRALGEGVEPVGHRRDLRLAGLDRFIAARNASPPGSARTAQPMCLRALRTPVNSPYSP